MRIARVSRIREGMHAPYGAGPGVDGQIPRSGSEPGHLFHVFGVAVALDLDLLGGFVDLAQVFRA